MFRTTISTMHPSSFLWSTGVLYVVCLVAGQEKIVMRYYTVHEDLHKLVSDPMNHTYETISGSARTKDQMKKMCLQSVLSEGVYHSHPNGTKPAGTQSIVQRQMENIESYFKENNDVIYDMVVLSVTSKLPKVELNSITCYSSNQDSKEIWSLLDIDDRGRYYVVYKLSLWDHFRVVGRLEAAPELDVAGDNQAFLEDMFVSSLRPANGSRSNDICGVGQFRHFEICAAAAKFMNIPHTLAFNQHVIFTYEEIRDLCVRNGAIEFKSDIYDGVYHNLIDHKLGILPCALNTNWSNPQFYVFNDQFQKNMLYILKREGPDVERPIFSVVMRIKGVTSMADAFKSS